MKTTSLLLAASLALTALTRTRAEDSAITSLAVPEATAPVQRAETEWTLVQRSFAAGVITGGEIEEARAKLAEARIQAELKALVDTRQQQLNRVQAAYRMGVTDQSSVAKAVTALQQAELRLSKG